MSHLSDELPISISNLYNTSTIKQKYQKRILTINLQGLVIKPIRRTIKMTNSKKAFAYIRTSSKAPLETDEDSKGQYQKIKKYAEANEITIVRWFRDFRGTGRTYLDELIKLIEYENIDNVNYTLVDYKARLGRIELSKVAG